MRVKKINISIVSKLIIPFGLLALCICCTLSNERKASKALCGKWLRSDGTYRIEISEILEDGKIVAAYYNPKSINVGRSAWRYSNDELQVYIELQDENYPGSIYELSYDEDKNTLTGTYFLALYQQTYEVYFKKVD